MPINKHTIYNLFAHIPMLETERLLLRRIRVDDAEDMFAYAHLDEVTRYLTWESHQNLTQTRNYLNYMQKLYAEGNFFDWAVVLKETRHMVGTCGFASLDADNGSGEIGYVLNPAVWGNGYAPEAVREVMAFGFERLGLHRVECRYLAGNERSHSVMKKCGMRDEGTHREALYIKNEYRTVSVCAILRDEYMQAQGSL